MQALPETGFLRLPQIIGQSPITPEQAEQNRVAGKRGRIPRRGIPAVIPVAASTWWKGVAEGRFPQPVKIGGAAFWRVEDIRALVASAGESNAE